MPPSQLTPETAAAYLVAEAWIDGRTPDIPLISRITSTPAGDVARIVTKGSVHIRGTSKNNNHGISPDGGGCNPLTTDQRHAICRALLRDARELGEEPDLAHIATFSELTIDQVRHIGHLPDPRPHVSSRQILPQEPPDTRS